MTRTSRNNWRLYHHYASTWFFAGISSPKLEIERYQSVPIRFPQLTPCFPSHIPRRICCPDEVQRKIDGQIGGHSIINSRTTTHFWTYEDSLDRDKMILCRSYSDWHFGVTSYAIQPILRHPTTFSKGRSYRFHSGDLGGVWGDVAVYHS